MRTRWDTGAIAGCFRFVDVDARVLGGVDVWGLVAVAGGSGSERRAFKFGYSEI